MTAAHRIGVQLAHTMGWPDAPWEQVDVTETASGLATSMPIADMAAAAQGLVGLAAADLFRSRGGPVQLVGIDRWEASLSMTTSSYLLVDGKPAVTWDPLTGYHRSSDGWVYVHAQFAHLRDGFLKEFGVPADPDLVRAALAAMPGQEVEDRAAEAGVCAIRHRTRAEWDAHPQAKALAQRPVVALERVGDASPLALGDGPAPLAGVRVLDLSRVIAGPTMGRTLAEHGADVLRISAPHLPSIEPLVISTGFGKRAAHLDLRTAEGRAGLEALIREADVLIDGYRPGALAGHGFSRDAVLAMNPGLILLTLSAFGDTGPWGARRGFDTYIQAATGLAASGPDGPQRLPCQPLDYLSGYLGAAAAIIALLRRQTEGGGWHADLSLARMAMWVWEQTDALPPEPSPPAANPKPEALDHLMVRMGSSFGDLTAPRPARHLPESPAALPAAPRPLGGDAPVWLPR
ncbi:MAG: CoA transferase [Pseudomonadota bacterium]